MTTQSLVPAIQADELRWTLPDASPVVCYHRAARGRPLLLLHSMNAAASAFEVKPFFTDMTLPQPLYAPDLPGFGRSERTDRVYSPQFYAQVIADMIRVMDAGPVDVLALSTTAEFAARAALAEPELIRSLTFVSPTGFMRRKPSRSAMGARIYRVLRLPLLGAGLFRALTTRASIRFFLDKAFVDGAPDDMIEYAWASAAQPGASFAPFYFVSGQLFEPDAVGDLYLPQQLPVSVLYDEDPNITFDYLDEVGRLRENWSLRRIPGTRGLPQFEQPQLTQNAIEEFLTGLS